MASITTRPRRKVPSGPDRRAFLRGSWLLTVGGLLGSLGVASIGMLWPRLGQGFGAEIHLGSVGDVLQQIDAGGGRFEFPAGRLYLVRYDADTDAEGVYRDLNGDAPVMAIHQACVHLGCRVPWCTSSRWFECPCHGSRYNRWGEYEVGPAPRGLDRFPVHVRDDRVYVDTNTIVTGPTRTTNVLGEPPTGPHCK